MIDFQNIEKYRENNRIEAKRALGGLPNSIWETYSAFANTLGGIILLGVEEHADKSLHPFGLPDPEMLIQDFWEIIRNTNKVSSVVLSERDVTVENINGRRIVAIRIPRAARSDKPVFIDGDPYSGSYRRNGEGDYRCTQEEVLSMMRDAAVKTQDMTVLEGVGLDALSTDSIRQYRLRMMACRPGHVWEELEDVEFLYKLGAVGLSKDGKMHPTAAGLLMFGYEREIIREYPAYSLEYREYTDSDTLWSHRILSSSGDWSGNIFDFYCRIYPLLTQHIHPRTEDAHVRKALHEALANCLVNADYYGRTGLTVVKRPDAITLSNPGGFRIDVEDAKSGGISDPRNGTLIKMFSLIDASERIGSGIPNIFSVWKKQGWPAPVITENFEPDRITLSLTIGESSDQKATIKNSDKTTKAKSNIQKQAIINYLTEKVTAKTSDISALLGVKDARARRLLTEMVAEETLVTEGETRTRVYKLKA